MSLNLTGLADVAERSLQQITEIADDRRQTLDGAKHHAHVDVRLNELEESALSSLLMPMCARPQPRSPRPVARPVAPRTISPRTSRPTSASACHTRPSPSREGVALAAGCLRICWARRSVAPGQREMRSRWRPPTGLALALLTLFYPWFYLNSVSMTTFIMKRAECGGVCAVAQLWAPS